MIASTYDGFLVAIELGQPLKIVAATKPESPTPINSITLVN